VYNREDLSAELQQKLAEILALLLEIFSRSTKVIKGGSGGRITQFAKNILLGKDDKLQDLVTSLEKLCQSEHRLVGSETLIESKKIGRAVENIAITLTGTSLVVQENSSKVSEVSIGVQNISRGQKEFRQEMHHEIQNVMAAIVSSGDAGKGDYRHKNKIKSILQPSVNPLDIFNSISKKRVPGTGDWIRTEQLFQAWTKQKHPVLWISGNPGSGKSFLSENIITYLQELHPQSVNHPSQPRSATSSSRIATHKQDPFIRR
jgi:hypothetical protein